MKKLLLLLVVLCAPAFGQLNWFPNLGAGAPSNPCGNQQIYVNTSNGDLYTCTAAAWVKTGYPQTKSAGPSLNFMDDFIFASSGTTLAGTIGAVSGNGLSFGDATAVDINHPGVLKMTTGTGGTGTGETIQPTLANGIQTFINLASASVGWTFETAVYVPVLPGTTSGSYQWGVVNTVAANPWTTGIGFYLSSANGTANDLYCRYSSTSTDTTVAMLASTWTRLTIISDATKVHWYVNGAEVCGTGVVVGSMPAGPFGIGAATTALSGTSITSSIDYWLMQRTLTR